MSDQKRQWVLEVAYPGLKPFMFGTLEVEREEELHRLFEERWALLSPHPRPAIVKAMPGMLVFVGEGE